MTVPGADHSFFLLRAGPDLPVRVAVRERVRPGAVGEVGIRIVINCNCSRGWLKKCDRHDRAKGLVQEM